MTNETLIEPDDAGSDGELDGPIYIEARAAPLTKVLVAVLAVAALVAAGAGGYLLRGPGTVAASAPPVTTSVDAGFARDMSAHHTQAVTMAGYERDNTTNPSLKLLAFDIETSQEDQIGQMTGWLTAWGLGPSDSGPVMAWMSHDEPSQATMPGMATTAQLDQLESAHGTAMDILFLQLMIHHHQGGLTMEQYAADNASEPYVRSLAAAMIRNQNSDIINMEQLLRQLGGSPLAPPAD